MYLRNKPIELSEDDVKSMLLQHGFYDRIWNDGGKGIEHAYHKQSNGEIVFDSSTGLYWQQDGSEDYMKFVNAQAYVSKLNDEKFAGYDGWRLPTLEEAMSLMEPEKKKGELLIDPVFDITQDRIWTADKTAVYRVWFVIFDYGCCLSANTVFNSHVRAVRS